LQAALARRRAAMRGAAEDSSCGWARSSGSSALASAEDLRMDGFTTANELQAALARRRVLADGTTETAGTSNCCISGGMGAAPALDADTRGRHLTHGPPHAASLAAADKHSERSIAQVQADEMFGLPKAVNNVGTVASPCRFGKGTCFPAETPLDKETFPVESRVPVDQHVPLSVCAMQSSKDATPISQNELSCQLCAGTSLTTPTALPFGVGGAPQVVASEYLEETVVTNATEFVEAAPDSEIRQPQLRGCHDADVPVSEAGVILIASSEIVISQRPCSEVSCDEQSPDRRRGCQSKCCTVL